VSLHLSRERRTWSLLYSVLAARKCRIWLMLAAGKCKPDHIEDCRVGALRLRQPLRHPAMISHLSLISAHATCGRRRLPRSSGISRSGGIRPPFGQHLYGPPLGLVQLHALRRRAEQHGDHAVAQAGPRAAHPSQSMFTAPLRFDDTRNAMQGIRQFPVLSAGVPSAAVPFSRSPTSRGPLQPRSPSVAVPPAAVRCQPGPVRVASHRVV
jgi:hypothetical protein